MGCGIKDGQINTKLYFSVYCLAFAFDGFLIGFPGSVYVELQQNLDTSVLIISWIYSSFAIGYIISNIICGYLADHIQEVHRLHSFMIFITSICIICIPLLDNLSAMFILFTIIGSGFAANQTYYVLLVFRLYPIDGGKMFFWCSIIVIVFSSITAALIEDSIFYTGTFLYPFIAFGVIGIIYSISILFLSTPKHDHLRSIKRSVSIKSISNLSEIEMSPSNSRNLHQIATSASERLKKEGNYEKLQNVTLVLLWLCMGCQGGFERGITAYITTYCNDYLEIDDKWGRYYIICFYGGTFLMRLFRQRLYPNATPVYEVFIGFSIKMILMIIFIIYGDNKTTLFILYILIGIFNGMSIPGLCSWGELIKPTTGMIACMWWVFYGIFDAIMSFTMGAMINKYGAFVMPIVVIVPVILAVILNGIAVWTFRIAKKKEEDVFQEIHIEYNPSEEQE